MVQKVAYARKNQKIKTEDDVFVAVAWTYGGTLRMFKLCPHVVTLDITAHTNKNKYHLLTFSIKTSIDKQVVFFRLWLPNQRRLSFRWVFQHAVPKLIPSCHLLRVKLILKDGDTQQQNELQAAIPIIFPNAVDGGCGFHIVTIGGRKHLGSGKNFIPPSKMGKFKQAMRNVQQFLYALMRPGGVENDEEYAVAKAVLAQYIQSSQMSEACHGNTAFINHLMHWITNHVLVHDQQFLWYRRKSIMNLESSHLMREVTLASSILQRRWHQHKQF